MRAVSLSSGVLSYEADRRVIAPHDNLVPVDVLKAGICETDLQLKQGYMGFSGVLGHEFVGIAKSGKYMGRRVVGEINCACHQCRFCQRGLSRHCLHRTVIGILNHDGAFADTVYVPDENLHPVPDHLCTEHAVFTEPVAAACRILEQVSIASSDRVIIFGGGRLGNLCAQVLQAHRCQPLVVGKHDWKLQRLRTLGIETSLLSDFQPASDADFAIDCTGAASGFESAVQAVKPCGTVIQKTTIAAKQDVSLAPIVIDEITVLGSRCGPFQPALKLLSDNAIDVQSMITAEYPLEDAVRAFERAEAPEALKVLLSVVE